jgi:putative sigma-54 modulation protein
MNKPRHPNDVIVSGIHLELTESLKANVREKMDRLFRHESQIVRIKVELECDRQHDHAHKYIVKGHIIIHGPDINATVEADECYKAIDLLVDKLDQGIRKRHGVHKDKRNHPHPIEFDGVALPKAI